MATIFPAYSPEDVLGMPLAKILFLHSGVQVLEGTVLPEKHLSPEERVLTKTASDSKDELISVLDEIRGIKRDDL